MRNLIFLIFLTAIAACRPFDLPEEAVVNTENKTLDQLTIPDAFVFNTHKDITLKIAVKDNNGQLMPDVPLKVFIKKLNSTDSLFLLSAQTNTEGVFETTLSLDADVETLVATTDYIGLPSYQATKITSNNIALTLGAENNINLPRNFIGVTPSIEFRGLTSFTYMGTYDADGVPKYLTTRGDVVSQSILRMVNSSLPESKSLLRTHPEFLTNTAQRNVVLKERGEVSITFVHEGTGNYNALGYYTYPTSNPPATAADITNLKVIFPNSSYTRSGGGLRTGDKVVLGTFAAGTTVAWFVMPKAWDTRTQKVIDNLSPIHYSDKNLNTFTTADYREHVVTLLDAEHELLLVGFEDIDRPAGDNDFNDVVFYATATPFSAIETTNIVEITKKPKDEDGDNVPDTQDVEPNNPLVASYSFSPALGQTSTLAFEDLWPLKGDYDMNDVVVDYNIQEKLDGKNKITQIKFSLTVRALGGSFRNGFGIELPIPPNKIASIEGTKIKDTYIKLDANGTEAGQTKAVIIAFDNAYSLIPTPSANSYFNTEKEKASMADYAFDITVTLNDPVTRAELGTAPYNPFIIVNKERGREVHLAGYKPTKLANTALFGTGEDNTKGNRYYQSKTNLPWALNISTKFKYPIEKAPINNAYLKFNNWVESGGTNFQDWYMNKTNYTNPAKIY